MLWNDEREKLGKEIIRSLYEAGMIKTWYKDKPEGWTLVSGIWSPLYIQLRPLSSHPKILRKVGHAMGKLIKEEISDVNKVVGVAMAGIPISTAISLIEGFPSIFTRKLEGFKDIKELRDNIEKYGEHSLIEGELENGDRLAIIDDLVTRFDSKLVAIEQIKYEIKKRKLNNVRYNDVVVLFDREQGAGESAKEHGINLHSLIPFRSKGILWLKDLLAEEEFNVIIDYLQNPDKYQYPDLKEQLFNMAQRVKEITRRERLDAPLPS